MKSLPTLLLCLLPVMGHAQVMFKCTGESGKVEYSDSPCSNSAKTFTPRESLRVDGQAGAARQLASTRSAAPASGAVLQSSRGTTPSTDGGRWICETTN